MLRDAGTDDSGLVRVISGRHGWVDRHHDAHHRREILDPRLLDHRPCPKGTGKVFEHFRHQLLSTQPRALVFSDNRVKKRLCQVKAIFVRAAPRDDGVRVGENVLDQFYGLWRGGYHTARIVAKAESELQIIPGFREAP